MTLSIIIPLYNEEKRFSKTDKYLTDFLKTQKLFEAIEIILVDDGSTDNTREQLEEFAKKHSSKIVGYKTNRGKGYAIREGMRQASGDYALFLDADMSTEPQQIEKFMQDMKRGIPVIIGSRRSDGSQVLVPQPAYRIFMGMAFTALANLILGMQIPDFTCGFKCFSRKAKEDIFPRSKIARWSFDTEILFIARKRGFEIRMVPVIWKNDATTTVRLGRDIIKSFTDLLRIRWNYATNKYI